MFKWFPTPECRFPLKRNNGFHSPDRWCNQLRITQYEHEGNLGIKGREAFRYEGKEHLQKHHLYVCPQDSAELNRHILFREYLRAHPKAVREYGDIKLKGAALYPYDIDRYIENKSPFIKKVYSEIGLDDCDFE